MVTNISALEATPIQRLEKTWAGLTAQEFSAFDTFRCLISPKRSYAKYRETLKSIGFPVIPYIGVTLSDLTYIDEALPDTIEHDLLNFQKCVAIAGVVSDFVNAQNKPFVFPPQPRLQRYSHFVPLCSHSYYWTYTNPSVL